MPAARDTHPGRRAARWVAPVGLCGGAVCLLAGSAFQLSVTPAAPPAIRAEGTGATGTAALREGMPRLNQQPGRSIAGQIESSVDTPTPEEIERPRVGRFGQAAGDVPPTTRGETRLRAAVNRLALPAVAVLGTMLMSIGAVFALLDRMGVLAAMTVRRHGMETPESRHDLPTPESRSSYASPARDDPAEVPAPRDHAAGRVGAGEAAPADPADARTTPAPDPALPDAEPIRGAELSPATAVPFASGRGVGGETSRNAELPPDGTTAPAEAKQAGGEVSRSVGPRGTRGAGPEEPTGAESTRSNEPFPGRAAVPASTDAARPDAGMQSPEPHAPLDDAGAHSLPVDEPPPPEPPQPGDLIDAWDDYRRNGDGHFSPRGLQDVLHQWGLDMDVGHGKQVGADGAVLVVEFGARNFYVLPSFNKSPRAVANWFNDHSSGALTGRTQRLTRLARGRWLESGSETRRRFEVIEKGEIA